VSERGNLDLGETPDLVLTTMSPKVRSISVESASRSAERMVA